MELTALLHLPVFGLAVYQMYRHGCSLLWCGLAGLSALIIARRVLWAVWSSYPEWVDRGLVPVLLTLLLAVVAGAALGTDRRERR